MKMHFSILYLVCLLPAAVVSVTFRLEAESASKRHTISFRSNASNSSTVYISKTTDTISFPFCFYRPFSNANLTVVYSNDGGEDEVGIMVNGAQKATFKTVAGSDYGKNWNVFRSVLFQNVALKRGYNTLLLTFESLDTYGVEIDFVGVSIDDEFMTEDVFRCQLMIGNEPQFSTQGATEVSAGYVRQHSYKTPCPEEDNVHITVHHPSVKEYTLTATPPLYHSMNDNKTNDDTPCVNLGYVFWKFEDVLITSGKTSWKPTWPSTNLNNAKMVGNLQTSSESGSETPAYEVTYTVTFTLKGVSDGFIDAEIWTNLTGKFSWNDVTTTSSSSPSVRISYIDRQGQEKEVDTFEVSQSSVEKRWELPEMTWSEKIQNVLMVKVTDRNVKMDALELDRGYTGPDRPVSMYESDFVALQGWRTDFWWRRPKGESLTVTVGDKTFSDLFFVTLYMPVPWAGQGSKHQVFVLYQDGNARLVQPPYTSPYTKKWLPFGTSVILGQSDPTDLRPAAGIKTMTIDPLTLKMTLHYYDGSSCKLALILNMFETKLKVTDLHFPARNSSLPFASFRSMYVAFKNTDSDSVQSETAGPHHVMSSWTQLNGREFLLFRAVESHHLTQSPNIRLTIDED